MSTDLNQGQFTNPTKPGYLSVNVEDEVQECEEEQAEEYDEIYEDWPAEIKMEEAENYEDPRMAEMKLQAMPVLPLPKRNKKEVAAEMMGTKPKAVLGKLAKAKRMQPKAPPVCQGCDRPAAVDVKGLCPGYCCNCCKRWCAGDNHGFQNRHGKDCSLGVLLVSAWKAAGKSHDFQDDPTFGQKKAEGKQ